MREKKFEFIFDCGSSRVRGGAINVDDIKKSFYNESEFFFAQSDIDIKIKNIVTSLEKNTDEYLDSINLMIDSQKMLTIGGFKRTSLFESTKSQIQKFKINFHPHSNQSHMYGVTMYRTQFT